VPSPRSSPPRSPPPRPARSARRPPPGGRRRRGSRVGPGGAPAQQRRRRAAAARRRGAARGRARTRARAAAPRVAAAIAPAYVATRSAAELGGALGNLLSRREDGRWGVMVVSLTRGDTLFAREPDTPVVPASTMKMFTSVLAFDRLGPDWRFRTEALRAGPLAADGTLAGDLVLRGDGDPSLSRRFWAGPEYGRGYDAPVRALARRVAAAGVKRVTGAVVADASAFEARTIPDGWLSRYAGSGYAAPFGALSLNENIVVVAVHPDGRVLLEPAVTGLRVENAVRVVGGGGTSVRIHRAADGHVVARGAVGRRAPVTRLQLTVGDPALFTAGALAAALEAEGVRVDGGVRAGAAPAGAASIAALESPPLASLVAVMNRESINIFAEDIFRRATRGPARDQVGSAEAGNALLQRVLAERAGVPAGAVTVSDGSGLSVLDRVTARSMVHLLGYAHGAPWGPAFHASLPVAGESELMRHRMVGTPAAGNLHAKTGTTNDVIALGGYATAENGEVLAFSFVFNGRDRWNARATIDAMGATLASFAR
jgi:D-alanyl-D-alanine carboxypeptidase/D-alanyl-D-alanine-endopeptidase (penicillin-binding protein 4)